MRCGDGWDDVFGTFARVCAQECFEITELVSDVFELFVEVFSVVSEPVLDGFEQIPGEVGAIAFGVAVLCDVIEPLAEEVFVGLRCDGQSVFFEPVGGPGDGVKEHAAICIKAFIWWAWWIKSCLDLGKDFLGGGCFMHRLI